jgi:hypothetical protein
MRGPANLRGRDVLIAVSLADLVLAIYRSKSAAIWRAK